MNTKNNRRFQKTEELIQKRVVELLEKNPDSLLSISAICDAVPINRSSFYLHYKDMEALLDAIILRLHRELMEKLHSEGVRSARSVLQLCVGFLNENRFFLRYYIDHRDNDSLKAQFTGDYSEFLSLFFGSCAELSELQLCYLAEFVQAGVLAVLTRWLRSGNGKALEEISALFPAEG